MCAECVNLAHKQLILSIPDIDELIKLEKGAGGGGVAHVSAGIICLGIDKYSCKNLLLNNAYLKLKQNRSQDENR